jgi:hypothetical protein
VPYTCIYENLPDTEIDRRVLTFLNLPVQPVSPSPWFYETFSAGEQARKLSALVEG